MNLHHLKYFYDSARLGSMSKAAEANFVGQPAISKGIQNLESILDKELVLHERNRFQLTDAGEIVFSYCLKVFSATEELKDAVAKNSEPEGLVRFACPSSMAGCDFITSPIKSINAKYPKISLNLMLGRTSFVRDWLIGDQIDFGIVLDNVDLSPFECTKLSEGHFHLVKSRSYLKNWRSEGVFTVEGTSEVKELHKKYKAIHKESLNVKMEIGSWGVIQNFVLAGMGAGYLPDYMIASELKKKSLVILEQRNLSIPYVIKLIRGKDRYLSLRTQSVIEEF
ncbi:MAG: LysR family transcriptional regulator [Bdellovibrionales bacterium]|nr:LysR family transcriptional regulator [Bdellovibrionales bacterium]